MPRIQEAGADPEVTIVIPAHRAAATVMKAITSALEQDQCRARVIVVVDGACPETEALLAGAANPRLSSVTNEPKRGAPASRNRGLQLAETEFVLFLDGDDFFKDDFAGPLSSIMNAEDADLGLGPNVHWNEGRGYHNHWVPDYRDSADLFIRWCGNNQNVTTCSVMWRTSFLRSIGGWNERILRNQDGEVTLRAVLLGARFAISNKGWGVWRQHESQHRITGRTDNLQGLLDVAEELLVVEPIAVPEEVRRRACARYLYRSAHKCFVVGEDGLGEAALRRSRMLGLRGHLGNPLHVVVSTALGLKMKQRLTRSVRAALQRTGQ